MLRGEISEYPYTGTISRVVQGTGRNPDTTETIYEGVMDSHLQTDEEGRVMQTAVYVVSIPLTKDKNDKWIVPRKGDKITVNSYDYSYNLTVDNADPSQIGGVSIWATRNSW